MIYTHETGKLKPQKEFTITVGIIADKEVTRADLELYFAYLSEDKWVAYKANAREGEGC